MRRHAKASSAGSNQRQATGLGRIFRGANATRGSSPDATGTRASSARRLALPLCVLALALAAIPASASQIHLFKETFGSAAQPTFETPRGIAVDQSTGDVLVMDAGTPDSIKRFNADGTPDEFSATGSNVIDGEGTGDETPQEGLSFASASESQVAVDNSGGETDGDIYVTQSSPNLINIFSEDGEYLGQLTAAETTNFSEACGVAVDGSGSVYVGDYSGGIHKFTQPGTPHNPLENSDSSANFSSVTNPCTLAAGSGPTAGFLLAAKYNGPIYKLDSSTGELKYEVSSDNNRTVTVDSETGHVYGATGSSFKEFDASGSGSATLISTTSAGGTMQGIAVKGSSGSVYVSRSGNSNVSVYGPTVALPDVTTSAASSVGETTATLNGSVNPEGVELEECFFEFGKTAAYGETEECAETPAVIGTGTSAEPVHADLSGLDLGAEYHFRLVAINENGEVKGGDQHFELESPPVIDAQWAQSVVLSEAILKAEINPEGFATTYYLKYGTDTSDGNETEVKGVGSDKVDHIVTESLEGLSPGTTYHYRFVATNAIGTTEGADHTFTTYSAAANNTDCPNQAYRTGASATLADCRAYEMVSPVDKNGKDIFAYWATGEPRTTFNQSAVGGDKITYTSAGSFGDQLSALGANQYIATRGAAGWSTHGINAPRTKTLGDPALFVSLFGDLWNQSKMFSPDLSEAWITDSNRVPLTADAGQGWANLYRRDNLDESYEAVTRTAQSPPFNPEEAYPEVAGRSSDSSSTLFTETGHLTADALSNEGVWQVYDYTGGAVHLVSVLPDGSTNPTTSSPGTVQHGVAQTSAGQFGPAVSHAISADGSRIFWTASLNASAGGGGSIYVRESPGQPQSALNGSNECTEPAKACTRLVVAATFGTANRFWAASTDGSKLIYTTGDPGTNSLQDGTATLSEFDVDAETTVQVAGEVGGVVGASDDLSYVYFTSKESLASGANAGDWNLYVDHEGTVDFIAAVSPADRGAGNKSSIDSTEALTHVARVTPDGHQLAFQSLSSLTGYDNIDASSGKADIEVYLYDANTSRLTCVSCNPSGAKPVGQELQRPYMPKTTSVSQTGLWAAAWLETWVHNTHQSRALSDDGNRLYFNSFDALVPWDTNGVQDVYQWEASGSGTCQKADGCISLISTGESSGRSEFVDASADGSNVFIETDSGLDPRDPGLRDIYDARVNGGFPLPPEPPACEGDACQSVPPAPPATTPSSASFHGAGNAVSRRNCSKQGRKARKLSNRAKRLRRPGKRAKRNGKSAIAKKRNHKATRLAQRARSKSKRAKRCRRTNRRAGR